MIGAKWGHLWSTIRASKRGVSQSLRTTRRGPTGTYLSLAYCKGGRFLPGRPFTMVPMRDRLHLLERIAAFCDHGKPNVEALRTYVGSSPIDMAKRAER